MPDTLIIGGQPNFLSAIINTADNLPFHWEHTGREIVEDVDAEKTLDLTPSVPYRAMSACSGEYGWFARIYPDQLTLSRGISCVVSNLADVGGKCRAITATTDVVGLVYPDGVVGSPTNTTGDEGDVNNDPFSATPPATFVTPTVAASDMDIEFSFANATALWRPVRLGDDYTDKSFHQLLFIYFKWNGNYTSQDTQEILIQIKEGSDVRAIKHLRLRPEDGDTFITSVMFDPNDFDDPTCDDMSVRILCEGSGTGPRYWEIGSVAWMRIAAASVAQDTGWVSVENPIRDLYFMNSDAQVCVSLPYLNLSTGALENIATQFSYFMVYWDDSYDYTTYGRPRIFYDPTIPSAASGDSVGTPSDWRPEIGLIAEGPAFGTDEMEFGYTITWVDPSTVTNTIGGNRWVKRLEPFRRLDVSMHEIPADEAARSWIATMRRAGVSMPFILSLQTGDDDITAHTSMYAYLTSFSAVSTRKDSNGEWFQIKMTFEECL